MTNPSDEDKNNNKKSDPTFLTTQQLHREMQSLREILESRLDGYDRAITLLQATVDKSPTIIEVNTRFEEKFKTIETIFAEHNKAVSLLQAQLDRLPSISEMNARFEERFHSIQVQFVERDTRTEQTSRDSKVAVDAALQAAKEAVGEQNKSSSLAIAKSETSTMKQIDQIGILIETNRKSLDDKIDDIKERLTSLEGQKRGLSEEREHTQVQHNWSIGVVISIVFGSIGILIGVVTLISRITAGR